MANEFTIHIDVTASKSESTDKEKLDKVTKGTDTASSSDKKEKKSDDELKDGIKAVVIYNFAKKSVNQIVTARLSTVGSRYGDEALQSRIDNAVNVTKETGGFVLGVAAAAKAGGVVGAVLAVATEALAKTISMYQNAVDYTASRMEDERETSRKAERLGVVASGAGRRTY
jgi:hypothetical protein